jgi:hypothetical protein
MRTALWIGLGAAAAIVTAAAAEPPAPPAAEKSVVLPADLARVLTDYEAAWGARDAAAPDMDSSNRRAP